MLLLLLQTQVNSAHAEPSPVRCHFVLHGARVNQFTTSMDQYGNVRTTGTISSAPFDCSYQILDFSYSPEAEIPKTEFYLHRKSCALSTKTADRTRDAISLKILKTHNGFLCSENLVVNYPDGEDRAPQFNGKEVKLFSEKFKRGVWP